ncbi:hypothetical protein CALVIDRAFT_542940 [Calocera viscosa TUFC12733]|uniref:Dienelactone hydrolase domain-containing protein n=1 Tax=Calocera viscosa (strain TUFC12733) TaxID=1330018 RepID=A0A167G5L0_CALVF|nr:hypothetical protein CALVIDRAFT_542940 [Calocera viscosa TUFC12733]
MSAAPTVLLAGDHTSCCSTGVKHTGTPLGELRNLPGLDCTVYISYPPDKSTTRVLLFYPDVYGPRYLNNQLLMDYFAKQGFLVVSPDYFHGEQLEELQKKEDVDVAKWAYPFRAPAYELVEARFIPAVKRAFSTHAFFCLSTRA